MNKIYTSLLAVAVIFLGIIALRPVPAVQKAVQTFGANAGEITYWISGDFSDDLSVGDSLTVTGDLSAASDAQLGTNSTITYIYVGTADGCGAWTFSASGTTPTLTPTSTSFCN